MRPKIFLHVIFSRGQKRGERRIQPIAKLTNTALKGLVKKSGRHTDGGGLYFRVLGDDKAYWAFRYRVDGKVREMSLGPYPEELS
jgi:hypothetical protein